MREKRLLLSCLPVPMADIERPLAEVLAEALGGAPGDYSDIKLEQKSLDARHKASLRVLLSIRFQTQRSLEGVPLPAGARLEPEPAPVEFTVTPIKKAPKVVIVGTGPAGSFCALRLLDYGIHPILLDRGPAMDERVHAVEGLWQQGLLNTEANAQFGEGGAGTFSDGKLYTRVNHKHIRYVLDSFVRFGAGEHILQSAKPHIGTDRIRRCCVSLRREAESRGAQYLFKTKLVDIRLKAGRLQGVVLENGQELACDTLVLAIGHSARDTFEMLHHHGVAMKQKPFAMGVRIEHPQSLIDAAQYGNRCPGPLLHRHFGPADYKLACNISEERAAYSFCMCPGGEVILCSSEAGGIVVNGMSNAARNSGFANSGLVAKVNPADFGSEHVLAGMHLQRHWEQVCFQAIGEKYGAPAQPVAAFLRPGRPNGLPDSTFKPFLQEADLSRCLPAFICEQLRTALPVFEKKIRGFTSREALLIGIESRTSSPVQMVRNADGQSVSHPGLYPCGEGAGYAGGITSAALDGMRVGESIAKAWSSLP